MKNLECVGGVEVFRQEGKAIWSRICPRCGGKGCSARVLAVAGEEKP